MHTPKASTIAPRPTSMGGECCTDQQCESGLRNTYFEGKRLTPDMFRIEQRYLVERRRLLNRAIHGWGIAYGYGISSAKATLTIQSGFALDKSGRELLQVGKRLLKFSDAILLDKDGQQLDTQQASVPAQPADGKPGTVPEPPCWLLSVHYAEQDRDPVSVKDPCHCDRHEWDHICETVRYSLREIQCSECCDEFPCELTCECGAESCCKEPIDTTKLEGNKKTSIHKNMPFKRGGCRCFCDHLTGLQPGADCTEHLCGIKEPCGLVKVDLRHGVPLACVKLEQDDSKRWTFSEWIDACGPRRLVKRNDLLFDLIRGCDLTRIAEIGWHEWHRKNDPIGFDEFSEALGYEESQGKTPEYVSKKFWVKFSRPVLEESLLRPDCFAMTVMSREKKEGWWNTFRVPLRRIDTALVPKQDGDPNGYVRSARLVFEGAWGRDVVEGWSEFLDRETRVEVEVRGDFIIDCNGQPVDANAVGVISHPTGNGSPGGTFMSTFRVKPRPQPVDESVRKEGAPS
ncbi:MAG: hypothetical protein IT391_07305 [Nitrospira sp.]|nr:hypothetical protein [Nitrospira sp.]